jgi:hypothetical protein
MSIAIDDKITETHNLNNPSGITTLTTKGIQNEKITINKIGSNTFKQYSNIGKWTT